MGVDSAARRRVDEDLTLVMRVRAGDRSALERLVRRHDARVLHLAWRLLGDADEAKDVRQAAFLRMVDALPRFAGDCRFETWLVRIVINLCRDARRRRAARERRTAGARAAAGDLAPAAEAALEQDETAGLVAAAVRALPADEREVIVLRHWQGLTFARIARLLEQPETTVKSRLTRGLERLRRALEDTVVNEEAPG